MAQCAVGHDCGFCAHWRVAAPGRRARCYERQARSAVRPSVLPGFVGAARAGGAAAWPTAAAEPACRVFRGLGAAVLRAHHAVHGRHLGAAGQRQRRAGASHHAADQRGWRRHAAVRAGGGVWRLGGRGAGAAGHAGGAGLHRACATAGGRNGARRSRRAMARQQIPRLHPPGAAGLPHRHALDDGARHELRCMQLPHTRSTACKYWLTFCNSFPNRRSASPLTSWCPSTTKRLRWWPPRRLRCT